MNASEGKSMKSILKGEEIAVEPKFLHRILEESIQRQSLFEKPALIYQGEGVAVRKTSYRDLNESANRLARAILQLIKINKSKENQDGDWIIGVCMEPSDIRTVTLLAIWKAGASYLPIDFGFPSNRITHIMEEAQPVLIIYEDSYPSPEFFAAVESTNFSDLKRESRTMRPENLPDELLLTMGEDSTKAVTLYTSGSTGVPKGVRLRHHTLNHRIQWQLRTYPFSRTEQHCISKTSLTFIDHVAEMWCPLFAGRTLVIVPKEVVKNPESFVPILEDYRVERLLGVPTLLRSCLLYLNMMESNKTKFMLSNLRMWISSGEPLTVQLAREFFDYFPNGRNSLLNFYGCTEVNCDVCTYELTSEQQLKSLERIPIGTPLPNTWIYLLDKDMQPVDDGEIGEVYCAGVSVTDGYINGREPGSFLSNPMDTTEPYNRMYRTGDFGVVNNGILFYEGRRDAQIKIRGHRIDISEVETNVNQLDYVETSSVLVYHSMQVDQALVAFISTSDGADKTPADVETDLKARLADYMIPQVRIIKQFPYLPNGKIDRQALLKMYEEVAEQNKEEFEMELDLEDVPRSKQKIAKEVFEIIGNSIGTELRSKISTAANFFDLGGNSMNSVYTVTQLRNKGFHIGLTDFLKAKNLGEVLSKVSTVENPKTDELKLVTNMKLVREPLDQLQREECIRLLATSFLHKADIDKFIPGLKLEHYVEVFDSMWDVAIRNELGFMVKTAEGDLVGVALNFDVLDEPPITITNPLAAAFDFLEFVEHPVIQHKFRPMLGQVFHGLMMGTAEHLDARENIGVMGFMESQNIKIATAKGFRGVFTTNTNPLTQQFGESIFGYETIAEIALNKYIDKNGNKPFAKASNIQKAIVMYKSLK